MSTSIENLRRLAQRDVKDHTAIFDLYVSLGRNLDYISIKFGMELPDVVELLRGYGEKIEMKSDDEIKAIRKKKGPFKFAPEDVYDTSDKGRYAKLPRMFTEEYVERFYPGISSENPQNDWICIDEYLRMYHPNWASTERD